MSATPPPSGPFRDLPSPAQVWEWIADLYGRERKSLLKVAGLLCDKSGGVVDPLDVVQAAITKVAMDLLVGKLEYRGYKSLMALVHHNIRFQALMMGRKERMHQSRRQANEELDLLVAPPVTVDPVSLLQEMFDENKASLSPSQRKATQLAIDVELDESRLTDHQRRLAREAIAELLKLWNKNQ